MSFQRQTQGVHSVLVWVTRKKSSNTCSPEPCVSQILQWQLKDGNR